MWVNNLSQKYGWELCWKEGDQYWFFWRMKEKGDCYDLPNYPKEIWAIVYLVAPEIEEIWDGYIPASPNNVDEDRGAIPYDTKKEQMKTWNNLMKDPVPFIIKVRLCG